MITHNTPSRSDQTAEWLTHWKVYGCVWLVRIEVVEPTTVAVSIQLGNDCCRYGLTMHKVGCSVGAEYVGGKLFYPYVELSPITAHLINSHTLSPHLPLVGTNLSVDPTDYRLGLGQNAQLLYGDRSTFVIEEWLQELNSVVFERYSEWWVNNV